MAHQEVAGVCAPATLARGLASCYRVCEVSLDAKDRRILIIHGHFYQPPRENPWTEAIDRQPSAAPYHDWNARVNAECYRPNSASRILEPRGRIEKIVNNYRRISFNFGPTLVAWLAENDPEVLERIRRADVESLTNGQGHGNALAQAYNHMILPLANARDRRTQIRWGIADFEARFGRQPEAMWLPETAVNYEVLADLFEHGMRFVILSPYQAKAVRPLPGKGEWTDVSGGKVDTSRPYRCYLRKLDGSRDPERYVSVFFYHGELSRRVSFDNLLTNASTFADAIESAFGSSAGRPRLVSIATDGETYGHHKPFGDMALAYLLEVETPKRAFEVMSFARFLDEFPAQWEAEIDEGPDGRGSSWSCAHGVGRWFRDCGCSTGGQPGWNQKWRTPLRRGLDAIRDRMAELYEAQAGQLFVDPWAARDAYIQVILDRSPESLDRFFSETASHALTADEMVRALKLLEMQRHAMLMYTSCGWFFADISGIETQQILAYAARALELAEELGGRGIEAELLAELEKAKSNLKEFGDGKRIYEEHVKPKAVGFAEIVHDAAVRALAENGKAPTKIFHFTVDHTATKRKHVGDEEFLYGDAAVQSGVTRERRAFHFAALHHGGIDFRTYVHPAWPAEAWAEKAAVLDGVTEDERDPLALLHDLFETRSLRLRDLPYDERRAVADRVVGEKRREMARVLEKIFDESRELLFDLAECRGELPEEMAVVARVALSERLKRELGKAIEHSELHYYEPVLDVAYQAEKLGVALRLDAVSRQVGAKLADLMRSIATRPRSTTCLHAIRLLDVSRRLGLSVGENFLQDRYWELLQDTIPKLVREVVQSRRPDARYVLVASLLQLGYQLNFNVDSLKDELRPLEELLSQRPEYWP